MNEKNTIEITWVDGEIEFTKQEQRIIDAISVEKDILKKIINRQTNKLIVQLLNGNLSTDYIEGYKKAMTVFLSIYK